MHRLDKAECKNVLSEVSCKSRINAANECSGVIIAPWGPADRRLAKWDGMKREEK